MEVSIMSQLTELIRFAALGLGLGLLYDLMRPMRYSGKGALLWDGIFCFCAAAGCFTAGRSEETAGSTNFRTPLSQASVSNFSRDMGLKK